MVNPQEQQQKILDAFGIGNCASASGASSVSLRCYQVGDNDWFAATSSEQALELMREIVGDDAGDHTVTLTSNDLLDKRWVVEGEPGKDAGSLREWLSAATKPGWIAGTEP